VQRDGLGFIICVCYSWEMALNVGLDASFNNIKAGKVIQEKGRKVNSMKACITNYETSCRFNRCYTCACMSENVCCLCMGVSVLCLLMHTALF
jgi:hypothetical protein